MSANDPESLQKTIRRWIWRLGIGVILFFFALIAVFVVWRVRLSSKIRKTLEDVHAAGYPNSLSDLEQTYYPTIHSHENAANFFQDAFSNLHLTNTGLSALPDLPEYESPKKAESFSAEKLQVIKQRLATNQAALDQLRGAPGATNCRYPINIGQSYQMLFPHLSHIRDAASLLSWRAVLESRNGDTASAIKDLNAVSQLCHSLDREPVLFSQLTRIGRGGQIFMCLEYLLNSQPMSDTQLAGLSQAFRDLENSEGIERGFVMEICEARDFFEMSGAQMYQLGRDSNTADSDESPLSASVLNRGYRVIRMTGFFERDYLFFLSSMQQHLQDAHLPFPQRLDAEVKLRHRIDNETSKHFYILSLILPSFDRVQFSEAGFITRINIAQTALAIERFRLANQNRLPVTLSDLLPSYLPAMLADPFDGKPIRYKKLAKGYLVYSIGKDRKDDGGVYAYRPKEGAPSDITFVVER